ncbi:MAG TPA: TRC40/GET3/ArsA family transport-energizing ATPase [Solirubrobacteraceae bacterium]|nr:TRC40/GET3/ArsA family transport-energizing ATPase [Solirubrobacteraceae bacterium]
MTPRTILYTGKGGVGKTSVAAATAVRCAAGGKRTLILSTDPAHSLSDSLQAELGSQPTTVAENLEAAEIDAQHELSRHWQGVQDWFGELLMQRGLDRISAEELTVPPGVDELFSLLRLREHHASGDFDVIVIDCAPTGETMRLLSFPEAARWWLEKIVPLERAIIAAAAPLARTVLDIPLPTGEVFNDIQRLSANLIAMDRILRDTEHSSIRLVMAPDRMVIGEAMRTFTYLNLYGYLTDAVIVNKVFPEDVGDYFAGWREHQQQQLELVRSAFAPVPVLELPYFDREVIGAEMLALVGAELFDAAPAGADSSVAPDAILHDSITQSIESDADGATLRLSVPFAKKSEIGLKQVGLELIVTAGKQRRAIMLPPTLAAYKPVSATYVDGNLEVSFSRGE